MLPVIAYQFVILCTPLLQSACPVISPLMDQVVICQEWSSIERCLSIVLHVLALALYKKWLDGVHLVKKHFDRPQGTAGLLNANASRLTCRATISCLYPCVVSKAHVGLVQGLFTRTESKTQSVLCLTRLMGHEHLGKLI